MVYFRKAIIFDLADFQHKYLFYLVNKKWIFDTNGLFSLSSLSKIKLFLLIISENIHRTKKVVKQKMSHFKKTRHIGLNFALCGKLSCGISLSFTKNYNMTHSI